MTRLIDFGTASVETKQTVTSATQLDAGKIVENGLKYRAKDSGSSESKVRDNA